MKKQIYMGRSVDDPPHQVALLPKSSASLIHDILYHGLFSCCFMLSSTGIKAVLKGNSAETMSTLLPVLS